MNSPVPKSRIASAATADASHLTQVLLVRIVAGGGREAQIAKDLHALVPLAPAGAAWTTQIARLVGVLVASGHAERHGDRLQATVAGASAAAAYLGARKPLDQDWPVIRDSLLVAKALGLEGAPSARVKALAKVDGLSGLIVESHWQLKLKGSPSASRLRTALALVVLERAFGNQIKSELGAKTALSAKASRLLAGQLAKKPRDFRTDARLVSALALEAVGARKSDLAHLRLGVLGRYLGAEAKATAVVDGKALKPREKAEPVALPKHLVTPPVIADVPSNAPATQHLPAPAHVRPDPSGFALAVKAAARTCAEGWPGNRRAFVSNVWAVIRERQAHWGVNEIEFKAMLTETHRMGLVVLANADLKDRKHLETVAASAVTYKNTVWHYVRVED